MGFYIFIHSQWCMYPTQDFSLIFSYHLGFDINGHSPYSIFSGKFLKSPWQSSVTSQPRFSLESFLSDLPPCTVSFYFREKFTWRKALQLYLPVASVDRALLLLCSTSFISDWHTACNVLHHVPTFLPGLFELVPPCSIVHTQRDCGTHKGEAFCLFCVLSSEARAMK